MTTPGTTKRVPSVEDLALLYVLDSLKGFGPQKFKLLFQSKIPIAEAIRDPGLLPIPGKRGDPIRDQLRTIPSSLRTECVKRAEKQLGIASATNAVIITYGHALYPRRVFESNNPIPILYARGNPEVLLSPRTVACVGSRNIREPYKRLHAEFAEAAVKEGFTIVSGFALGADTVGHKAAVSHAGQTICVMPSGLDRPFPPENKMLWQEFLENRNVAFVSEFPFGTGAASLNLKKRNKLIVAFAQGVLVSQSSVKGGAMNAYRFALEQKKPVASFQEDETDDTSGNKLIVRTTKNPGEVFVSLPNSAGTNEYVRWLRQLSFLT